MPPISEKQWNPKIDTHPYFSGKKPVKQQAPQEMVWISRKGSYKPRCCTPG